MVLSKTPESQLSHLNPQLTSYHAASLSYQQPQRPCHHPQYFRVKIGRRGSVQISSQKKICPSLSWQWFLLIDGVGDFAVGRVFGVAFIGRQQLLLILHRSLDAGMLVTSISPTSQPLPLFSLGREREISIFFQNVKSKWPRHVVDVHHPQLSAQEERTFSVHVFREDC